MTPTKWKRSRCNTSVRVAKSIHASYQSYTRDSRPQWWLNLLTIQLIEVSFHVDFQVLAQKD